MKKHLATLFLATAMAVAAHAQAYFPHTSGSAEAHEEGGRMFTGGAITFWSDPDDHSTLFEVAPEVGYLFNDTWGVGLMLGYEYERQGRDAEGATVSHALKLSPFGRYYYLHRGPFNLYVDGSVGISRVSEKLRATHVRNSSWGFEAGLRPGACVDLTEGLCLCLRMGFVGYRHRYTGGEEERIGTNGFGLRFAPEELMIGLELEF